MIQIRYQQLVFLPCCVKDSYTNVIHMFGTLQSREYEEELRKLCQNTKSHPQWKAKLISDHDYSYLPYEDYTHIDKRTYIYEKWNNALPLYDCSFEDTCIFIEQQLYTVKKNLVPEVLFLSWMYNIILYNKRVARTYNELLEDWCYYIRLDCPCFSTIHNVLEYYNLEREDAYQIKYVPFDQWLLLDNVKHSTTYQSTKWKVFCKQKIINSYQEIKNTPFITHSLLYMILLPILWEILEDKWRFILQVFIDDSLHSSVIYLLQEWLNQNGCLLCCSYKLNYVPTLEDRGTSIIHVDNIHIHLNFIMEDNFSNIKCSIHPTLENIEKSMCLIPHFMYDMYSNDF